MQSYVEKILRARVYDVAKETPLDFAPKLSHRFGERVLLKREDLQPVFSFKLRGAYNKIASLPPEQAKRGLICASAGNHAQGVALAAAHLGYPATIVMPRTTPEIKVDSVARLGAEVVLYGDTFDDACAEMMRRVEKEGFTFIHPFDDPLVIAGQGTIAVEMLRQHAEPIDAIFIPVGGGGLLAGILSYVKFLQPDAKVIAVEPDDAACLDAAQRTHRRGIVILISDLLDDADSVLDGLNLLHARKQEIVCFHILDRFERELPFNYLGNFVDPETGDSVVADPVAVRSAYLERLGDFIATVRQGCWRRRIDYVPLDTAEPMSTALAGYLRRRLRR